MELKTDELAALLGVTGRRVNQLFREGVTVRLRPGVYDGPASIAAYIASVSGKAAVQAEALDAERELARLRKEQADGQALKNEVTRGSLLPADEVERAMADTFRRVRSGVLSVTSRVRHQIPTMDAAQAAILDRELRDALTALAHENSDDDTEGAASADTSPET